MKIINLTQHVATKEQMDEGVFEPAPEYKTQIKELLTFTSIPTSESTWERAQKLTVIAMKHDAQWAMIGGAGYLMADLESALCSAEINPIHSFTQRVTVEKEVDGAVVKESVFKHVGFVSLYAPLGVWEERL